MRLKTSFRWGLLIPLLISFYILSCNKEEEEFTPEQKKSIYVSKWIYTWMQDVYYWNNTLPEEVNFSVKLYPESFFKELLFKKEDKWSFITENVEVSETIVEGTQVSMGFEPAFIRLGNTNNVVIMVIYVYPGSPADKAGMERGDMIVCINHEFLNTSNYYEQFNQYSYTVTFGNVIGNTIYVSRSTAILTAASFMANPLIHYSVLSHDGTKTGYLVYTAFSSGNNDSFLKSLGYVFDNFKAKGIRDLIVDLRYNQGGELNASAFLASAIAPADVVNNKRLFARLSYNQDLQSLYEETEGANSPSLNVLFPANSHNLDLSRVTFLTSPRTASASELLITGLEPYMDVTVVGEQTFGKYMGSWVIYDTLEPRKHNWLMMPIIFKYANADGFTDFKYGLTPDYLFEDDPIEAKPFGSPEDPMLAYALDILSGNVTKSAVMTQKAKEYVRLDSEFDKQKRNLTMPAPAWINHKFADPSLRNIQ